MSFNRFIEEQIQKAVSEGKFDNLPGAGKPVNLDDYFNTPEDVRLGYSILKNGDILPPQVELLREIGALKEKLAATKPDERKSLQKRINEKQLELDLINERYKRRR